MNKSDVCRTLTWLVFVSLLGLVAIDSAFHFDQQKVQIKTKHYSAQRNWSLFYGQSYVFNDSSTRYKSDFVEIKRIVKPDSIVLSDLASSYYVAAHLPVYVVNLHRHQGSSTPSAWKQFLATRVFCYIEFEENRVKLEGFLKLNQKFDYVLVNKDRVNSNRKRDCLAFRSKTIIKELPRFANLVFEGEFLNLYALK